MTEGFSIHPVEDCLQHWLREAGDFARHKPTQVLGAACAAGVLLNLVPAKVIARSMLGTVTSVGRPALLALGLLKLLELACSKRPGSGLVISCPHVAEQPLS